MKDSTFPISPEASKYCNRISASMAKLFRAPNFFSANNSVWFRRDLNEPVLSVKPDRKMEIVFNSSIKIVDWLRENSAKYPWVFVEDEIRIAEKENHSYPFVIYNDDIIGYMKIAFNRAFIQDFRETIRIPPKNAFIYDTFVRPEERGKRVGTFLLSGVLENLKMLGYERLWCHIPLRNKASLQLYRNAGFERVSNIRFFSVAKLKFFSRHPERIMGL
jgi:GNAT superfamily N-acetyltransferase